MKPIAGYVACAVVAVGCLAVSTVWADIAIDPTPPTGLPSSPLPTPILYQFRSSWELQFLAAESTPPT